MTRKARELGWFAVNNSDLYLQITAPILDNLTHEIKKGHYDSQKNRTQWINVATQAAQKYHDEFGTTGTKWFYAFQVSHRLETVDALYTYYVDELLDRLSRVIRDMNNQEYEWE